MGALKLTIQQFYRVNGDSTQVKGVEPDIHIPSIFDQAEFGEGKMDNALKFDHVAPQPHDQFNRVPRRWSPSSATCRRSGGPRTTSSRSGTPRSSRSSTASRGTRSR